MTIYNKFLYKNEAAVFSIEELSQNSLHLQNSITQAWERKQRLSHALNILFCGFASYFQAPLTSKEQLMMRLSQFENSSEKLERATRCIQRAWLRKKYTVEHKMYALSSFQVQNNSAARFVQLTKVWWDNRSINLFSGARGQIIWQKATQLGAQLKKAGYYVFYHAHSYPITLHLELTSFLQANTLSSVAKQLKPAEARRKFRAPDVGELYENTTSYLKSTLGTRINRGLTIDDNHRETILSCDAIESNKEAFESAQHFFKSNQSIVDTKTSTGKSPAAFDHSFISGHLKNRYFQNYSVALFATARSKLSDLPGYGMVRVIAVAKKTLENSASNYVWRSHAFGRVCACRHTPSKIGHEEFVATLQRHQSGENTPCNLYNNPCPQYRILAKNLDRDTSKQIYTMDCLSEDERKKYNHIYYELQTAIVRMQRLETLPEARNFEALRTALLGINLKEDSFEYKMGVELEIRKQHAFILPHWNRLKQDLPPNVVLYIQNMCEKFF